MTDTPGTLEERLRKGGPGWNCGALCVAAEAADEIASLRARLAAATAMREAIREAGVKRHTPVLYNAVMLFDALKDTPDAE